MGRAGECIEDPLLAYEAKIKSFLKVLLRVEHVHTVE